MEASWISFKILVLILSDKAGIGRKGKETYRVYKNVYSAR